MNELDLEAERDRIRALQLRASRAQALLGQLGQKLEQAPEQHSYVVLRCEANCGRQLARIYMTAGGPVFVSMIRWFPSDDEAPAAWRQHLLELGITASDLDDDERLRLHLEGIRAAGRSDPRKWVAPNHRFDRLVDLVDGEGPAPDLWVRCRYHPGAAHAVDRPALRMWLRAHASEIRTKAHIAR